tara:strand:- start:39 stop:362 length:324 start_codon:yes stop_codon:yes gene_type:complete
LELGLVSFFLKNQQATIKRNQIMSGRGLKLIKRWGGFSEKGEKIISLAKARSERISSQQKPGFEIMSQQQIRKKLESDTQVYLDAGGKIEQIPEGKCTSETTFQDKT